MHYVLVSGKRDFTDYEKFKRVMDRALSHIEEDITIVEGGARGTDFLAKTYATEKGYSLKEFPADWDKYGKAAGPMRNMEMVKFLEKMPHKEGIFFWDWKSRGTMDCLRKAEKAGIICKVYTV